MRHSASPNVSQASVRQLSATSSVGTGCQLWLLSMLGVLWSPVTINTSGFSAMIRGMAASTSSIRFTFASKLPSSPVLSVYLKWMKKKSYFDQFSFEHVDLLVERLRLADDVHADQPGEALVHRIDGDRRGLQAVHFFVAGQIRLRRRSRAASGRWPSARPARSLRGLLR